MKIKKKTHFNFFNLMHLIKEKCRLNETIQNFLHIHKVGTTSSNPTINDQRNAQLSY